MTKLRYSDTMPGNRGVRTSDAKPLDPSGPFGWRMTVNLGPASSREMVRNLLIKRSGLACTSLLQNIKYSDQNNMYMINS